MLRLGTLLSSIVLLHEKPKLTFCIIALLYDSFSYLHSRWTLPPEQWIIATKTIPKSLLHLAIVFPRALKTWRLPKRSLICYRNPRTSIPFRGCRTDDPFASTSPSPLKAKYVPSTLVILDTRAFWEISTSMALNTFPKEQIAIVSVHVCFLAY